MIQEPEVDQSLRLLITQALDQFDKVPAYKAIKDYISINKPSINFIEESIKDIDFSKDIFLFIDNLQFAGVQRSFFRVLFNELQKNQIDDFSPTEMAKLWKKVWPQEIKQYIDIFKLNEIIKQQDFSDFFRELIQKKKFEDAFQLFNSLELHPQELHFLLQKMNTNQDCAKAADFVNRTKLPATEFPYLLERLEKQCSRYIQHTFPWYKAEELLSGRPQTLAYYCEDIAYKGQADEAYSIAVRNNLVPYIKKADVLIKIQQDIANQTPVLPNPLYAQDHFGPTDYIFNNNNQFLTLEEFGQNEVYFIDTQEAMQAAVQDILSSSEVGIDCEFMSSDTKLDKRGTRLELFQVANQQRTYVFDFKLNLKDFLIELFGNSDICKVGQAFKGDLQEICKLYKLPQIDIRNYLDLAGAFKYFSGEQNNRNLAHISQHYFKKPISKYDQQSNWCRRPLLKCHLHYAGLDALVCLHIYSSMKVEDCEALNNEKESFSVLNNLNHEK